MDFSTAATILLAGMFIYSAWLTSIVVCFYWMMWHLRVLMPRRSSWRVMQFDTLRLRLVKLAVRAVDLKRKIKLHLPTSTPDQAIFALVLGRLPRLTV
jgi:hypothetical protein